MNKARLVQGLALCAIGLWTSNSFALKSGIMDNKNNECAIYLCLPQGFPGADCQPPLDAFIKRTTTLTSKGDRIFTDLPDIGYCLEELPADIQVDLSKVEAKPSIVSYRGAYEVYMPAINKCTRWNSKQLSENQSISYCAAVVTTPARVFESDKPKHPYETINVGDTTYTQGFAPVKHYTEVLVDGELEGKRYYN